MKKSELRKIIKEVIQEQQPGPSANPLVQYVDSLQTVGAKGCCPDLYAILDFIKSHQTNINSFIDAINQASAAGNTNPMWLQIFQEGINMAQNAMENGIEIYNDMVSTGCCKSITGKPQM